MGAALPIGGGIGGLVLVLLFSALTGQNPLDLINSGGNPETGSVGTTGVREDDPHALFVSRVLADTEETWRQVFGERGEAYAPPILVLFTGATQSACGTGSSAMGPFYCPVDRKVYLDLSFFQELDRRFDAPGDFAQAYVIAHEVGHHVQNLLGIMDQFQSQQRTMNDRGRNALSVRLELQADCFAGVTALGNRRGTSYQYARSFKRTALPACGDSMRRSATCSSRAIPRKDCAPRRPSVTTACSSDRRATSFRNRSHTAPRRSGWSGSSEGSNRAIPSRATRSRANRIDERCHRRIERRRILEA
jgi:hypothetical protein